MSFSLFEALEGEPTTKRGMGKSIFPILAKAVFSFGGDSEQSECQEGVEPPMESASE